jgi:hypothetical protein
MVGAVIEVDPSEVVLVDADDDGFLDVLSFVPRQGRFEVERGDLEFIEIRRDDLVRVLASEHGANPDDGQIAHYQTWAIHCRRMA